MNCEGISCANLLLDLLQELQLPLETAGLDTKRMSPRHGHIQARCFTSFSGKHLKQAASFLLDPGFWAFLPQSKVPQGHQPELSPLLACVLISKVDACNKMEEDWGEVWDW